LQLCLRLRICEHPVDQDLDPAGLEGAIERRDPTAPIESAGEAAPAFCTRRIECLHDLIDPRSGRARNP
jgi:hypothetical protein